MLSGGGVYPLTERVPFDDVAVSTDSLDFGKERRYGSELFIWVS